MSENREIRVLSPAEVETLIDWAAGEGWNPGLADAPALRAAEPEGFLGIFDRGEMMAGITAVAYGEKFGFIGLYISRPDMRGKGYGKAVWDAGMARLEGRTIGLDAVPAQLENYRSMGFLPAYKTHRFSGRFEAKESGDIRPITPERAAAISVFDTRFFPEPRPSFIKNWPKAPRIALAAMDGANVRGYGVARECREGFKIGPLFAEDLETAVSLLAALGAACGAEIHIDAPEVNAEFADILVNAGMTRGFETTRMYRGPAPSFELEGVFGVTTLELG